MWRCGLHSDQYNEQIQLRIGKVAKSLDMKSKVQFLQLVLV